MYASRRTNWKCCRPPSQHWSHCNIIHMYVLRFDNFLRNFRNDRCPRIICSVVRPDTRCSLLWQTEWKFESGSACLINPPSASTSKFTAPNYLVGSFFLDDAALCPVVGHSRPTVVASCTVCSDVFHHWIHHLWPQGAVPPQALTLFGGVGFIARRLRRPEKGNADGVRGIFGTASRVGLRPCDRTHLKNGLVPYSYVGGT